MPQYWAPTVPFNQLYRTILSVAVSSPSASAILINLSRAPRAAIKIQYKRKAACTTYAALRTTDPGPWGSRSKRTTRGGVRIIWLSGFRLTSAEKPEETRWRVAAVPGLTKRARTCKGRFAFCVSADSADERGDGLNGVTGTAERRQGSACLVSMLKPRKIILKLQARGR